MKNYRRNNYIGKMKKGFKQKLSLLMIACLLFTGYRGLTISGRADSSHTEQNNEIEVSGTQVKVQLLGADLRRAATEAILKGEKVGKSNLRSYSKDQELATEFEEYFDGEKEIYNIPLNSIAKNLEESLNAEEAGLQIYVERDAKDLDRLVRKESKESLLLYSKESAVAGLLPKKEEATTVSLTEEEKASDSNLERNTELTGSELITFVYENKSTERMTFQLSVDGNKYPKVTVASKTSLFKQFLGDAKKAQAEAKNAKATEAKAESTEAQTVEASKAEESSVEAKQEVAESKATEATKATEESKASEEARKGDSEVAIVSTAAEAVAESTEAKAEVKVEASEEATEAKVEATEAEVKEAAAKAETAQAEKATEAQKAVVEDSSFLKDITEHSEEILPELQSIRFTQYSLNELGRKSQNVEIEGFGNVQVFYDEAAFDDDVVLEAKRLFKPEEEAEGEKLSEEQVKVLKEHSIYDDAASLDIRFVDKKDSTVEVEPKSPVSVRISIDKKALPAEVSSDAISIHHLVENDETKAIESVETVVRSVESKILEYNADLSLKATDEPIAAEDELNQTNTLANRSNESKKEEAKTITKEFIVSSFSLYQISWADKDFKDCPPIRFHYVDKNFNEIGPTVRIEEKYPTALEIVNGGIDQNYYQTHQGDIVFYDRQTKSGKAMKSFWGYKFFEVYPYSPTQDNLDTIVNGNPEQNDYFDINYKYGPIESSPDGNFRKGLLRIDNVGYKLPNNQVYTWYTLSPGGQYGSNCAHDFYFVYDLEKEAGEVRNEVKSKQDKYITDNLDGTYDLTLTGRTDREKEKLDIIFLLDTTQGMKLPFDKEEVKGTYSSNDFDLKGTSKKDITKEYINLMVDEISKNDNYDVHYGLVGFGGDRTEEYASLDELKNVEITTKNAITGAVIKVERKSLIDPGKIKIEDSPFNDTTQVCQFTSSVKQFKDNLKNLPESKRIGTGANYTAAMIGLDYLMTGNEYQKLQDAHVIKIGEHAKVRDDSKKIIIMLSSGDPKYGYVLQNGVYDDTVVDGRKEPFEHEKNGFNFSEFLSRGTSYGNGKTFNRIGLNQARGTLAKIGGYTAFYTVGIGASKNWQHLRELTQAHGYDLDPKWSTIGNGKFIRAESTIAKDAESKLFNGENQTELKKSFEELENLIAPKVTNVSIEDTLSENVTLVDNPELEVALYKMQNALEGVKQTEPDLKKLGIEKLEPYITEDINGKQVFGVKIKPESFDLPPGYELRVKAKIKPSRVAYEKLNNGQASNDKGEERTDLQDIYRRENITIPEKYRNSNKYGASFKKDGLYTNDGSKFSYTWKGTTREKPYNNPIIKVQKRDLIIEKQIFGLKGEGYKVIENNKSKSGGVPEQKITELGKAILRDIKITVYEVQDDGTDKEYVSFKLYRDESLEDQGKESEFTVGNVTVKRHQVVYNQPYDRLSFSYTITGLNLNKKYKVVEKVPDNSYGYTTQEHLYELDKKENSTNEEAFALTEHSNVTIKNTYKPEEPKRKVTIEKIVKTAGLDYVSEGNKKIPFDFYLRIYHPDKVVGNKTLPGEPFSKEELIAFKNSLPEEVQKKLDKELYEIPPKSNIYAIHFTLTHGEKLEFMMDEKLSYDFSEGKVDGFNKPDIDKKYGANGVFKYCSLVPENEAIPYWFTCERIKVQEYDYVQFTNNAKLPVPTGIVRDITPYFFGIFGFVAMAGAYLTINKKRREA